MKSPFRKIIGIDPGKGGGIALISAVSHNKEEVKIFPCPKDVDGMAALIDVCLSNVSSYRVKVFLEKVWAFPTDGRAGSFTFGCNYGQWQGILASHELNPTLVTPKEWQSHFEIKKGLPKNIRKKLLKQIAIDKCPEMKGITLKTADALLIAIYGLEAHLSYKRELPWVQSRKMEKAL